MYYGNRQLRLAKHGLCEGRRAHTYQRSEFDVPLANKEVVGDHQTTHRSLNISLFVPLQASTSKRTRNVA